MALEVSLSNSRRHFSTERRFRQEVPPRSYRWLEAAESSSKYSVGDIITRCERDAGKVPENRGEAITRDGKTAESFRRKPSLFSHGRCRFAWATRYHSDGQFKVTIRRPFSCPPGDGNATGGVPIWGARNAVWRLLPYRLAIFVDGGSDLRIFKIRFPALSGLWRCSKCDVSY